MSVHKAAYDLAQNFVFAEEATELSDNDYLYVVDTSTGVGKKVAASAVGMRLSEQSADPGDPSEGQSIFWQSDGTGTGSDGDLMAKVTAGGVTKTEVFTSRYANVIAYGAKGDGTTDDTAAFIAAANYAVSQGVNVIVAPAGTYHCPDMTSDDMSGVYIVGDGVLFTATTYVAAWTVDQWIARGSQGRGNVGAQNGMISFEIDGSYPNSWSKLFPFTKSLGIVLGNAVQTADVTSGDAPWIKEFFRHGWEILSHSDTHADFTGLTESEIVTECETSFGILEAIIGEDNARNMGFVYPEHLRNEATDDVCRRYFTRGRAGASSETVSVDGSYNWAVPSYLLDDILNSGAMTAPVKNAIDMCAKANRYVRFYFHAAVNYDTNYELYHTALTEIVEYARSLGVKIVLPSQGNYDNQLMPDPYFDSTNWDTLLCARDTNVKYHGAASYSMDSVGADNGRITATQWIEASRPGHFAVVKASFRYKCASDLTVTAGNGIHWSITGVQRNISYDMSRSNITGGTDLQMSHHWPLSGTTIPAADWGKVESILLLPPQIEAIYPNLRLNLITANPTLYIDELRWELVDYITCRKISTTLNGTTGRKLFVGCHPSMVAVTVVPKATLAGRVYVTTSAAYVGVYSTDAADSGAIDVLIHPLESYYELPDLDSQVPY